MVTSETRSGRGGRNKCGLGGVYEVYFRNVRQYELITVVRCEVTFDK